jgi:hypothetical protein
LSVDELRRLILAAQKGLLRFGVRGTERAIIYRLAVESGFRSRTNHMACYVAFSGTEMSNSVRNDAPKSSAGDDRQERKKRRENRGFPDDARRSEAVPRTGFEPFSKSQEKSQKSKRGEPKWQPLTISAATLASMPPEFRTLLSVLLATNGAARDDRGSS